MTESSDGRSEQQSNNQSDGGGEGGAKKRRRRRRRKGGGGGGGGEGASSAAGSENGQAGKTKSGGGGGGGRSRRGGRGGGSRGGRRRSGGGGGGAGDPGGMMAALLDNRPEEFADEPFDFVDGDLSELGEAFDLETTFPSLGLRPSILRAIHEAGFRRPTKIQAQLIQPVMGGRDMFGQAKTGTGKTAAFGLPVVNKLEAGTPFQALILVPTRELAIQVASDINMFAKYTPLRALPVYGGQRISVQADLLDRGPEIVVATPGRVMDMVGRGHFHYNNITTVVLDEVDRMLDIGFRDDIKRILPACPKDRQTVFVTATLSDEIERLARRFCKEDCEKIVTTSGALTVEMVEQHYLAVAPWDKPRLLLHLLTHEEPALTIVFCRMKRTVDKLTAYLQDKSLDVHAIHGDFHQNKRNRIIEKLKKGNLSVLIASDLASRGLDVDGITHVVNYDLPEDPDLYVHRIGRTARAGRDGVAWSLVTPEQGPLLTEIEMLINTEIPILDYPDFEPGPVPADVRAFKEIEESRDEGRYTSRFESASDVEKIDAEDASKFPGGIVPSKMPPKMMRGKVRTRGG